MKQQSLISLGSVKTGTGRNSNMYSEQFRQANREAKTTVLATIVVILFWIAAGFGLADSDIVIFDTPIWVVGGCIVSWLFAVVVAWWLAEYVIKDVDMKEDATVKGGGK